MPRWEVTLTDRQAVSWEDNGLLLLEKCSRYVLVITNNVFQQADKYKTTWMHPKSQWRQMLGNVTVMQKDHRNVKLTKSRRGADCWSDHRLVRSKTSLSITPRIHRKRTPTQPKPNTLLLIDVVIQKKIEHQDRKREPVKEVLPENMCPLYIYENVGRKHQVYRNVKVRIQQFKLRI